MKKKFLFVGQLTSDVNVGSDGSMLFGAVRLKSKNLEDILAPRLSTPDESLCCTARVAIEIETLDVEFGEVSADDQP